MPITVYLPHLPRREPYFLSSHKLYLTSPRTKLSIVLCLGACVQNKAHCNRNEQKDQALARDVQIHASVPLESTHLGYRGTMYTQSPYMFRTQGDLSKPKHMLW